LSAEPTGYVRRQWSRIVCPLGLAEHTLFGSRIDKIADPTLRFESVGSLSAKQEHLL